MPGYVQFSPNINGGAFTDIIDAAVGGGLVSNGYNVTLAIDSMNPIGGRQAWGASSNGYVTTVANFGPNVNGRTIKLRFRMATDASVGAPGWRIDNVAITDASCAP